MQSTTLILKNLVKKYDQFNFISSDIFKWEYSSSNIYYNIEDVDFTTSIIHELSHALLGHAVYKNDIDLVRMESEAWEKTLLIAKENKIAIDQNIIDQNMDSYRDWIHNRSTCPKCQSTGLQTNKLNYKCLVCNQVWLVNDAKYKRLKRTVI